MQQTASRNDYSWNVAILYRNKILELVQSWDKWITALEDYVAK